MLLAATDALLALYAGLVLLSRRGIPDPFEPTGAMGYLLAGGLLLLGVLSVLEVRRLALGRLESPAHGMGGLRLGICLLVLLMPAWPLLSDGRELASLLAPYLYLAVSAAGARLADTPRGLAFTGSLLHLGLSAHVLVTLRYSLDHEMPRLATLGGAGRLASALAWGLLALSALQVLVLLPRPAAARREQDREACA
jgi:hypothetical protein